MESAMPGTTLQIIPLQAFESGGVLYGRNPPLNQHPLLCLPAQQAHALTVPDTCVMTVFSLETLGPAHDVHE